MNKCNISYLHEMKDEPSFIKRFVQSWLIRSEFLVRLGISENQCWIGINLNTKSLFPFYKGKPGDIDLIIGPMSLIQPLVVDLIAFECKWYNFESEPLETKNLPPKESGIEQVRGLVQLGFDKVYLTYFICKPPGEGINLSAWLSGSDMQNAAKRILNHPSESGKTLWNIVNEEPFGFIICEWGQVLGKKPESAGSISFPYYKKCSHFKINRKILKKRNNMAETINTAFKSFSGFGYSPLLLKQCENRDCRKLFFSECLLKGQDIPRYCDACNNQLL